MKLCRNCQFCKTPGSFNIYPDYCYYDSEINLVTGRATPKITCIDMRTDSKYWIPSTRIGIEMCGTEGKFYTKRKNITGKIVHKITVIWSYLTNNR